MATVTDDNSATVMAPRAVSGLLFAILSAATFGMSGALARPLLESGWSAGSVVLIRISLGAVIVLPFGIRALRGRWHLVHRHAGLITLYGLLAVAGAQFCYFSAVSYMQVGPALLIEYTAPAAVVVWLWLRHGQRPGTVTLVGAGVAALGSGDPSDGGARDGLADGSVPPSRGGDSQTALCGPVTMPLIASLPSQAAAPVGPYLKPGSTPASNRRA